MSSIAFLSFSCSVQGVGGPNPIVVVKGEVDMTTAGSMTNAILTAAKSAKSFVVVDVEQMTFIDARGLQALIDARLKMPNELMELVVFRPTPFVQRLLAMFNMVDYVTIDVLEEPALLA